jgi:hypothetical protein
MSRKTISGPVIPTGKVIVYRANHGAVTLNDFPSEADIKSKFGTKKAKP